MGGDSTYTSVRGETAVQVLIQTISLMSDIVKEKRYYLYLSVFSVKVYVCKRDKPLPTQTTVFQCPKLHHELVIWETCKQFTLTGTININYTTFPQKKSRVFFTDAQATEMRL